MSRYSVIRYDAVRQYSCTALLGELACTIGRKFMRLIEKIDGHINVRLAALHC